MDLKRLICTFLTAAMLMSGPAAGIVSADGFGSNTSINADDTYDTISYELNDDIDINGVNSFITRLYNLALGRSPDEAGIRAWADVLTEKRGTGISVAYGFIYSGEFQSCDISNERYVELMYQMFFGREADEAGKQGWVNVLESMDRDTGRLDVFNGFANSYEFYELCKSYGIVAGSFVPGRDVDQVAKINLFVQRLYNVILMRDCDKNGMTDWTNALITGANTGAEVAHGFFFSGEYEGRNKTYGEYIDDLYNAFMGRPADQAGRNSWIQVLVDGGSKEHVFNGFSQSSEFENICNGYGIVRGGQIPEDNNTTDTLVAGDGWVTEPTTAPTTTPTAEPTAEPSAEPSREWPRLELSGNSEDRITPDVNSYYEADGFILYVHSGATVRGSVAKDIKDVMDGLEELFGLRFDANDLDGDSDWRDLYFDGDFYDVNTDCAKVNIILTEDPHDGRVQCAGTTYVLLYEEDLLFDDSVPTNMEFVAAHELGHVLRQRQGGRIGTVLEEGIGVYAQGNLSLRTGYTDVAGMMQYLTYEPWNWSIYDDSKIIADPEGEFTACVEDGMHYYYGVRFVTFLIETYGTDVILQIGEEAQRRYENEYDSSDVIAVIKDCTSENVFNDFAAWLPEGWADFSSEYIDFLIDNGVDLSNFDLTQE